jgi:APA family basic amino acid/polyamine antiporter
MAAHLERRFGLLHSTALNMSNMVGVGPFITIPTILAAMGGPQCMLGWLVGVVIAICDGMVWAELSSAMPGSGGTYVYLKNAFEKFRFGSALPFLFIWQFILSGPLEIASGTIGISMYVNYFWRGMTPFQGKCVAAAVALAATVLLYRRITFIASATVVLWIGMLVTVGWVIFSGLAHFDAARAFSFPEGAFRLDRSFFLGLGGAMLIAMYDYLGYYDVCYIGDEVKEPARVIPRAIVLSVIGVALIYATMNLSIIGVIPWREAIQSKYIASDFMERLHGPWAGSAVTLLICWTAFASIFALLLGYSRIPYAAALDGYFFRPFAKLHPTGHFPHVSVAVLGLITIAVSFLDLLDVISFLMTARILVQFVGQIAAVEVLRRTRPGYPPAFRMWLYPLPSLLALVGWLYIFFTSGWKYVAGGLGLVVAGFAVYLVWRRKAGAVIGHPASEASP